MDKPQPSLKNKIDKFLSKPNNNNKISQDLFPSGRKEEAQGNRASSPPITNKELVASIMKEDEAPEEPASLIDQPPEHQSPQTDEKEYTIIIPKKTELDEILYQPDYFNTIGFNVEIFLSDDERNATSKSQMGGEAKPESAISLPYRFFTYFLNQRISPIPIPTDTPAASTTTPSIFTRINDQVQKIFNAEPETNVPILTKPSPDTDVSGTQNAASESAPVPVGLSWIIKMKCKNEPVLIETADSGKLIYEEREDVLDEIIEQMYHQKKYGVYMKSRIYKIDDRYILLGDVIKESVFPADFFGTGVTKPGTKLAKYLKKP